jgi:NitT/TauT family transport system permease protein
VLMGIGEVPKIFVIFLAAFLACVIATYQGVVSVDRTLINAARVLGSKDGGIFLRVVVPAQLYYDLATIFVGIVLIGIFGLVMDRLLLFAETKLTGWQERR